MTDALALLIILAVAVLITQLWLFVDGLRQAVMRWLYEWLQWREWDAKSRAAVAARKAQELAQWKDAQGRLYAFDFETGQVGAVAPAEREITVPTARQWQVALTRALWWGEMIGWTEKAWDENGVVYWPATGELNESGRREIIKWLDALKVTASRPGGRTWAAGMSYKAAVERVEAAPPRPEWSESPPPSVRIPYEGANVRSYEHIPQSTAVQESQ